MDRVIYTALTSLSARQRAQAVTANNLANAETIGFKREIIAAESRYLGTESRLGPSQIARAQSGAPSLTTPLSAGRSLPTGRPLDIALAGEAWLAVEGPPKDGQPTEAYTRRGDLSVSPAGQLILGDGSVPLDTGGQPIQVPPGATLQIGPDGSLSALQDGVTTPIAQLKLVAGGSKETGFDKAPDGRFTSATPLAADPSARLVTGTLETANINATEAMVQLVEQSRAFEASARLLRTARELDESGARLIRMEN
ncbi:MAG: flagellar hook-basal body complex protein [Polymorphobacter sp.]|uniref:flagellar hook-basal body complex protein n=1 Tax=Polymorphobacter sp. TaxID=1909290 RepID=UPI003A866C62